MYELWDSDTGNIVGAFPDLNALVAAAYDLGRANPDEEPRLSAIDSGQIAIRDGFRKRHDRTDHVCVGGVVGDRFPL